MAPLPPAPDPPPQASIIMAAPTAVKPLNPVMFTFSFKSVATGEAGPPDTRERPVRRLLGRLLFLLRGRRRLGIGDQRLAAQAERIGLFLERVVDVDGRTAELVDQVELRLVLVGEPLFASPAELVEVLVLHGVAEADFVRAAGLALEG